MADRAADVLVHQHLRMGGAQVHHASDRHSLLPVGWMRTWSPPPSESFLGLANGLAFRTATSLSMLVGPAEAQRPRLTAARELVDKICTSVPLLVLHDFDPAGIIIKDTLANDTRRYRYGSAPNVIDLGLR